jgi:hypothetical protein
MALSTDWLWLDFQIHMPTGDTKTHPSEQAWRVLKAWLIHSIHSTYRLEASQEVFVRGKNSQNRSGCSGCSAIAARRLFRSPMCVHFLLLPRCCPGMAQRACGKISACYNLLNNLGKMVPRGGIEPPTRGFSVRKGRFEIVS